MEDKENKGGIISDTGKIPEIIDAPDEAGGITSPRRNRPIRPIRPLPPRPKTDQELVDIPPRKTPDEEDVFDVPMADPRDIDIPPQKTPDEPMANPIRLPAYEMECRGRNRRQDQLVKALGQMTEEKGSEVFLDANQFSAMLSDYAPTLKEEARLWFVALSHGYGKYIVLYRDNPDRLTCETWFCLKDLFAGKTIQSVFLDPLNQLYKIRCSLSDLDRNPVVESIRFCSVQTETTALVWYPEDSVPRAYISGISAIIRFSQSLDSRYLHVQVSIGEMQYDLKCIGENTYMTVPKSGGSLPSGYECGKTHVRVTVKNAFQDRPYSYETSFRLVQGEYHAVRKIHSVEPSFVREGGHIRYINFRIALQPKAPSLLETSCWLRILDQQEHAVCDRITQLTIPAGASACYAPFGGEEFAGWKKGEYSYEISLYGSNLMRGTFTVS